MPKATKEVMQHREQQRGRKGWMHVDVMGKNCAVSSDWFRIQVDSRMPKGITEQAHLEVVFAGG